MNNIRNEVGQRLKSVRRQAGLTQRDLADLIGCHRNNIFRWELGQCRPSMDALIELAEALPNMDLHWLLTGDAAEIGVIPMRRAA